MNVSISKENEEHINRMVESGEYNSPDEVVEAAIRLLTDRQAKLAALREEVAAGLASGESLPGDQVMEELRHRIDSHRRGS